MFNRHTVSKPRPNSFGGLFKKRVVPGAMLLTIVISHASAQDDFAPIQEIFTARCVVCHSGANPLAGLRLDSREGLMAGSQRGSVIDPGRPDESELIRRVRGESQPRMPLTGPPWLSDDQIVMLARWIETASGEAPPAAPKPAEPVASAPAVEGPPTWTDVAPVLARNCVKCHTTQGILGAPPEGLILASDDAALDARDRARIVPGNADASELMRRIRGQARPRMPFDGPPWLSEEEMTLIERWIDAGARNAEGQPADIPAGAKVRLHGTLQPGNHLDGLALDIGPGTRIDKSPRPGDYVQVRGRVSADGTIRVERLRPRD